MMRLCSFVLLAVLPIGSGCMSEQLRQTTVHQASTLTDLQYHMVLENLAMFAANPGAMPWHVNLTGGATQLTDSGQGMFSLGANIYRISRASFLNLSPAVNASRTTVQQWGHTPVTDGDELRLLRIAYRRACGSPEMPSPEFLDDLAHDLKKMIVATEDLRTESILFYEDRFLNQRKSYDTLNQNTDSTVGSQRFFEPDADPARAARKTPLAREVAHEVNEIVDELRKIGGGWYGVGRKHDVPKDACYVAHHGHVYLWVCPGGVDGLTEFTLSILEMASALQPPAGMAGNGAGVAYSPGFDVSF
jgi:hypothetical protein